MVSVFVCEVHDFGFNGNMNAGFGCKQSVPHSSALDQGCLGDNFPQL